MPLLYALALGAAPVAASAPPPEPPANAEPSAEVQKLVEDCSAHRFETTITVTSGGKLKPSKVKLCGTPGQSDAEWINTLKDTVAKVSANPKMPPSAKEQIISAVNLEIVRLGATPAEVRPVQTPAPALANAAPLPAPRKPPSAAGPQYSALPQFPPPKMTAPATVAGGAPSSAGTAAIAAAPYVPPLPKPRLALSCFSAADGAIDGPCFGFERDTLITVRAGEPLKDTLLRFVRDGQESADYPLPPLARGRSARFALPREVCSRVVGGKLTIHIVRGPAGKPHLAQVVGTEGPYNLRC